MDLRRVLVVDDEPDLVELVSHHLREAGYDVTSAPDGARALEAVRARMPDAVVLDLMLPGLDGFEVCRRLRSDPATAEVAVLMLTARTADADVVDGLSHGADDYLLKPFSIPVLLARLEAVLRRRTSTPEARVERSLAQQYRLMQKIGEGSMGTVYKALQVSLRRIVAIKVLASRLSGDPASLHGFLSEARFAATLSHPNVVQVIDYGRTGRECYLVMEYVDGPSLRTILAQEGRLPERRAAEIALEIARALEHAGSRRVLHRDVKPDNILVGSDGMAKLIDLGLARSMTVFRADVSEVVGTPEYLSPEQAEARKDIDIRADIYGLGATLYHVVTGRPPFSGSVLDMITARLNRPAPDPRDVVPGLSGGMAAVILKAMARHRRERYATPTAMAADLLDLVRGEMPRLAGGEPLTPDQLETAATEATYTLE